MLDEELSLDRANTPKLKGMGRAQVVGGGVCSDGCDSTSVDG
jgi:hypothetical protein